MPLAETAQFSESKPANANSDIDKLNKWLMDAESSLPETTWRTVGMEDYRFYAGKQDDDDVIAYLEEQKRPTSTYNEIKSKIDMLQGIAAQTRHSAAVDPVGATDEALAELMTNAIQHYRRQTKLARKELDCFEHTVKSGRSLLHFYINKENPFKPKICCKRWPGWAFYIDSHFQEYDLEDARYVLLEKWLTEEEIKTYWPDVDVSMLKGTGSRGDMPSYFNEVLDKYRVIEGWYWKYVDIVWFINPMTGQPDSCPKEQFPELEKTLARGLPGPNGQEIKVTEPLQGIPSVAKKMYYSIFSGPLELEAGPSPYLWPGYPMVFYGAYHEEDTNSWFGVITAMKDPQGGFNTMLRQLQHLLQTLPKGILMHEVGAILNVEEYEERGSEPSYHMELAKGMIDRVKFQQQPSISPVYQTLPTTYSQLIKNCGGIQNEMMGLQTTSREPGVTVESRKETNFSVLFSLFDNFMESRDQGTRILMHMIQQYVTEPTLIRIEGDEGQELIQINSQINPQVQGFNDITAGEFDLVAHSVAETTTMRMQIASMLVDFAQNNPGTIPPDLVMEYSNIPYSVKQRIRKYNEQQAKQAAEIQDRELKIKEAEVMLKKHQVDVKAGTTLSTTETKAAVDLAKVREQKQKKAKNQ